MERHRRDLCGKHYLSVSPTVTLLPIAHSFFTGQAWNTSGNKLPRKVPFKTLYHLRQKVIMNYGNPFLFIQQAAAQSLQPLSSYFLLLSTARHFANLLFCTVWLFSYLQPFCFAADQTLLTCSEIDPPNTKATLRDFVLKLAVYSNPIFRIVLAAFLWCQIIIRII